MFDPQAILPMLKSSFPKASEAQLLEALNKLAKAHPDLSAAQALAAIQHFMQQKQSPTMGNLARTGRMI